MAGGEGPIISAQIAEIREKLAHCVKIISGKPEMLAQREITLRRHDDKQPEDEWDQQARYTLFGIILSRTLR